MISIQPPSTTSCLSVHCQQIPTWNQDKTRQKLEVPFGSLKGLPQGALWGCLPRQLNCWTDLFLICLPEGITITELILLSQPRDMSLNLPYLCTSPYLEQPPAPSMVLLSVLIQPFFRVMQASSSTNIHETPFSLSYLEPLL